MAAVLQGLKGYSGCNSFLSACSVVQCKENTKKFDYLSSTTTSLLVEGGGESHQTVKMKVML